MADASGAVANPMAEVLDQAIGKRKSAIINGLSDAGSPNVEQAAFAADEKLQRLITARAAWSPLLAGAGAGAEAGRLEVPTTGPVLPGAPAGASWRAAQWAQSWQLKAEPEASGGLSHAVVAAFGGSVTVADQMVRDGAQLNAVVAGPDGTAPATPEAVSTRAGLGLLVVGAGGELTAYGSGPRPGVVMRLPDVGGEPQWAGLRPAAGPVLDGLSGPQVAWAAREGQRFVGGGDFIDALAAATPTDMTPSHGGDAVELRRQLVHALIGDTNPTASPVWRQIAAWYRPEQAESSAMGSARTDDTDIAYAAVTRIVALIQNPELSHALRDLWPVLAEHYLGIGVRVIGPDGTPHLFGDGAALTVARVSDETAGVSWMGVAPVRPARLAGAGTRPADVAGGRSLPASGAAAEHGRAYPGMEPVPAADAAKWATDHGRTLIPLPEGPDGLLAAVLQAAGGGVTIGDGAYLTGPAELRKRLVRLIEDDRGDDPGLWAVIYGVYTARAANLPGASNTAVAEAIERGRALTEIAAALRGESDPELAEAIIPFLLHRLGLAVRVLGPDGFVGIYGDGRPIYVAPVSTESGAAPVSTESGAAHRWAALPAAPSRYRPTTALAGPNHSDPVLSRLGRAVGNRHGGAAPRMAGLTHARDEWKRLTAPRPVTEAAPARDPLTATALGDAVTKVNQRVRALDVGDIGPDLDLIRAVELAGVLYEAGGVRPLDGAGGLPGVPVEQWAQVPAMTELITAMGSGDTALIIAGGDVRVLVNTEEGPRSFGPDAAGLGQAIIPDMVASLPSGSIALVMNRAGEVRPAADLRLMPATDVPVAATDTGVTGTQQAWANEHGARIGGPKTGPNALFEAVLEAAGGSLVADGERIGDVGALRAALVRHIEGMATSPLSEWPIGHAAYTFEAEERIVDEFFERKAAGVDSVGLHAQIQQHISDGSAWRYLIGAIDRPGHWDHIGTLVAPALIAELTGRNLLILGPDGVAERHGGPANETIALARTETPVRAATGWAAIVSDTPGALAAAPAVPAGDAFGVAEQGRTEAELTPQQAQAVVERGFGILPTKPGPESFWDAVLAAAGGGYFLDRENYIGSAAELRETLAALVRERPDVLGDLRQPLQTAGVPDDPYAVADILGDAADPRAADIAQHLVGPYFGFRLEVFEAEGDLTTRGGVGRPVTIASTTGEDGLRHWAAFTPPAAALADGPPLEELPAAAPWAPDRFRNAPTPPAGRPWRESTYSTLAGGKFCVSVAVVYADGRMAP